ncbi:large subunit ribosomal protein L54 [Marchantia polymorpha subsp. ruderalis]|uniref:Large ribosomal subunit protein mL54 n=2 Tax=Marchantia polymorpha TaxID=3197 RepID=A0A176VSF3_MARPO|nr:hypothetical protein AXG93_620s1290 [Marchantia polymorpha subsp. ruderalis]PTQ48360.1 hypothetical protein MARPO_0005s0032 [Marchantia polymorpha]BBM97443.1 hypothetical protein Mp_1g05750 [Marchantia polymorpha subsp. ruderalis]|eukprot:PTQ48360.1 hypothetical protein MARPO_0005s0032 [Marchantia polymorpha]
MFSVRARALHAIQRLRAAGPAKGAPAAKKRKGEAQVIPVVAKELREKATLGANILKTGADPPILEDSEYPPWVFNLLDKRPALSELERRDPESLDEKEIMRLLKLDNRRRIKENNAVRSKE